MATDFIVNADTSPAIAALEKLSSKLNQVSDNFKDKFGKMAEHANMLGTALIAAGTAVAAFADDITDIADANQVAIEQVLGLSKALEASGGKADNVGKLFQTMSNNIEEANGGNLKTLQTFNRLGVSVAELGNLSNTALKDKLLDGLVKIRDPIERNAVAMQVFGKSLVGVDIEKFAASQKKLAEEMAPYAGSIKTAGEAWDNMVSILGKLKLAFAQAFEPIFFLLSKITINVDLATAAFRLLGIAVIAMTGATVLAGMAKLIELTKALTLAAARNPFVAIATALLAVGTIAYDYLGIGKDIEKQQDANNSAVLEGTRNQTGLNDAIKKEKDALIQIRETLERNWKTTLQKYRVELDALNLSEDQKKTAEAIAKVEEEAASAKFSLQQKFDALDSATKARTKSTYEAEIKLIDTKAEAQKRSAEQELEAINRRKASIEDLSKSISTWISGTGELAQNDLKLATSLEGSINKRIQLEGQFGEMMKRRQLIAEQISKLSPEDQIKVSQALNKATIEASDLIGKVDDLGFAFDDAFRRQTQGLGISARGLEKVTSNLAAQKQAISETTELLIDSQRQITEQSRRFSTGWTQAFNSYVDNATNAAMKAQSIFQSVSQNLEDALFKFFTTGKLGWKDFANNVINEMIRIETRQLAANILTGGTGKTGRAGSGLLGLGGMFGFLAEGGPASANKPYIVGERGPELFVPNSNGTVVPNNALGGGGNVTYNINAVDAMSFKQMLAQDPTFLHAVAEQGRRRLPGAR